MSGLRQAVGLLTRVPVGEVDRVDRAAGWFPLVGAGVGLVVAGTYAATYPWMPSLLAAVVAVAVGIWLTGAFHEDGLADTFDAFGGAATGEEALRIMRDTRLGTYGTVAVVVSVLWRVVAVGSLAPVGALAGLVAAHTMGRAGAVVLMSLAPAARTEGLGRSGVSGVSAIGAWVAVASGLVLGGVAIGWWIGPAIVAVGLTVIVLRRISVRRVGGVTGDVLGACEQIIEMLVLAVIVGTAWRGSEPWWAVLG